MNIFIILCILIFLLLSLKVINKKYEYFVFNSIFFLISIINIIKDNFTPDLIIYNSEYLSNNFLHFEPFFIILAYISKIFNFKFYFISTVYSILTFYFLYKSIKQLSVDLNLSLMLFYFIPGMYLNTFIQIRQMLAIVIVLYTVLLYITNDKKLQILLVLFSILVHYSALIFWIIFIILVNKKQKYHTLILLISSIATLFLSFFTRLDLFLFKLIKLILINFSLLNKYIFYLDQILNNNIEMVSGQYYKNLFFTLIGLFVGLIVLKSKNNNEIYIKLMTNLYLVGIIILNITMYIAPISRMFYYFGIFQIFLMPYAISKFKNKTLALTLKVFVITIYFIIFINGLNYTDTVGNHVFYNYSSYIF